MKLPGQNQQPLRHVVTTAADAEQPRQLRNGDGQTGTGFESCQHAVAYQLDQHAQSERPGEQAEEADAESRSGGNLSIPRRVPSGHIGNRACNHQRDC
jgi:hypothetical protein